jgi:LacI family transcriptional regulator
VDFYYYSPSAIKGFQKKGERIPLERYDGLLIAPMFYEAAEQFIKKVPSDLPYVFIGSKISDSKYLSYLGQDSFQSGVLCGMLMKQLLYSSGMIAIIGIKPWDYHIEERIKGFYSYFGNDPKHTVVEYAFDSTNAEFESRNFPKRVITENENIRGLFIPGGPAAPFAKYIQDHNLHRNDAKASPVLAE